MEQQDMPDELSEELCRTLYNMKFGCECVLEAIEHHDKLDVPVTSLESALKHFRRMQRELNRQNQHAASVLTPNRCISIQ